MTFPANIDCKIAQDLLVAYVAGEVSPETRDWLTRHLDRCPDCRQALAEYTDATRVVHQLPLLPPPADPGRRTIFRMRRALWVIITVVLLCLGITAGSLVYVFSNMRRWADMPADQPVPAATFSAERAVALVDLTPLGLKRSLIQQGASERNAGAVFKDETGNLILVSFLRADDVAGARRAFSHWTKSYATKITSVEMNVGDNWTAKFKSEGQYFYGWQHGNWLITISVEERADRPAELRDQVRDQLFTQIRALQ